LYGCALPGEDSWVGVGVGELAWAPH
jgi:hypothetical protein